MIAKPYNVSFFDLGDTTLLALEQDKIACSDTGRVTLLSGVRGQLLHVHGKLVFVAKKVRFFFFAGKITSLKRSKKLSFPYAVVRPGT